MQEVRMVGVSAMRRGEAAGHGVRDGFATQLIEHGDDVGMQEC